MRRARWIIAPVLVAAAVVLARQEQPAGRAPTTRVLDCTTSGCHADQIAHKFLHGPTAVGACESCHEYSDPAAHAFVYKRDGKALCTFCHIDQTGLEGPVVHQPVADGDCTSCHNPHGSTNRSMLQRDTVVQMCLECHEDALAGAHAHEPAATDCTACHKAHTASHKGLLIDEKRALCMSCHQPVATHLGTAPFTHEPATGDCLQCHRPHASDHPGILPAPAKDLCLSCHENITQMIAAAAHPHSAVTDGRACLNCHVPHASTHEMLLPDDPVAACMKCHKDPIPIPETGRTVLALQELALPTTHKHGPIREGDCAGCHTVHGGSFPQLLVQPYASGFYKTFSEANYALCFKCHDPALATAEQTSTGTGFRDGDRNLHFVHVTGSNQGRSCRACHTAHASQSENLIAEWVAYGEWRLPLNYKSTQTGGSCAPGCHRPETYDRAEPANPPP